MKLKKIILGIFTTITGVLVSCNVLPALTPTNTAVTNTILSTETPLILELPTSTAIAEITPNPTLSSIESENLVKRHLENNAGCSLPCTWSIEPGKIPYGEAQQFFESLGWEGSESHGVYYTGKDLKTASLSVRVGVYAANGVVEKLHIGIGGNDFLGLVKYFSFENILNAYGKPTKVLVFIGTNPGILEPDETSFELLLYYETKNTLIEYVGTAIKSGNDYYLCPSRPNTGSTVLDTLSGNVVLYVGNKSQIEKPETLVRPFWKLPNYYISSEKAFGMEVDEFYETVVQKNDAVCLESPIDAWQR